MGGVCLFFFSNESHYLREKKKVKEKGIQNTQFIHQGRRTWRNNEMQLIINLVHRPNLKWLTCTAPPSLSLSSSSFPSSEEEEEEEEEEDEDEDEEEEEEDQSAMEKISVAVRIRPHSSASESTKSNYWKVVDNTISLCSPLGTPVSGQNFAFGEFISNDNRKILFSFGYYKY